MGPIGVWGPHDVKGWWTGLMGQPHHSPKGPMRGAQEGRGPATQNPNPRACLGGKPPPLPPALEGGGAQPLASYIRRGQGRAAAPHVLLPKQPHPPHLYLSLAPPLPVGLPPSPPPKLAAPPLAVGLLHHVLLPLLLPWLRRSHARGARGDYTINATTTVVVPRSI